MTGGMIVHRLPKRAASPGTMLGKVGESGYGRGPAAQM